MKNEFCAAVADEVKFSGVIEGGFCWDSLTRERMKDPKALEPYGYKVYSQNDEDGIINEIFRRIGTTNKRFIEFGVQDGLESNCHLLLFYGWSGLWIEGSSDYCNEIAVKFRPVIENGQLTVTNAFITKDNINSLFEQSGFTGEIDLLSIDIDGNDLYIWNAINSVNPRVVITEFNGKFPPDLEWSQAYDPAHVWKGTDWHGASLKAFEKLAEKKGYCLVGTDLRGCNAFFVRADLVSDNFIEPHTAEALYNPLRTKLIFTASHPSKYCLAVQKDDLGVLNYQTYDLAEGFYGEEINGNSVFVWSSQSESKLRILVDENASSVCIPFTIPIQVIEKISDYNVTVKTNCGFFREFHPSEFNSVIIPVDSGLENSNILDVTFTVSHLWKPSEILSSTDDRSLGICIILSYIK